MSDEQFKKIMKEFKNAKDDRLMFYIGIVLVLAAGFIASAAHAQELPEHPQPQHQPPICQFPASVANCVYYNNPADSIPAPQSNPPYIYPVTHAKTHARRNMMLSGALSAATMSAVIILTQHDPVNHADAIIHKPVIGVPR